MHAYYSYFGNCTLWLIRRLGIYFINTSNPTETKSHFLLRDAVCRIPMGRFILFQPVALLDSGETCLTCRLAARSQNSASSPHHGEIIMFSGGHPCKYACMGFGCHDRSAIRNRVILLYSVHVLQCEFFSA